LESIAETALRTLDGLTAADKAPRCQHVRLNGSRCGSPAMRQRKLCYYHERQRTEPTKLEIPYLEDAHSVQVAITRVCQSLVNRKLDAKTAGVLLYGLQTAASNIKQLSEDGVSGDDMIMDRHLSTADDFYEPDPFPEDDEDEEEEDAANERERWTTA
jgi:hypothetical protein